MAPGKAEFAEYATACNAGWRRALLAGNDLKKLHNYSTREVHSQHGASQALGLLVDNLHRKQEKALYPVGRGACAAKS